MFSLCACVREGGGVEEESPPAWPPEDIQKWLKPEKSQLYRAEKKRRRGGTMGEIKSLLLVISGINGKSSPKKVFIRGSVNKRQDATAFQKKKRCKKKKQGKCGSFVFNKTV